MTILAESCSRAASVAERLRASTQHTSRNPSTLKTTTLSSVGSNKSQIQLLFLPLSLFISCVPNPSSSRKRRELAKQHAPLTVYSVRHRRQNTYGGVLNFHCSRCFFPPLQTRARRREEEERRNEEEEEEEEEEERVSDEDKAGRFGVGGK